jgi:hypothetical protein
VLPTPHRAPPPAPPQEHGDAAPGWEPRALTGTGALVVPRHALTDGGDAAPWSSTSVRTATGREGSGGRLPRPPPSGWVREVGGVTVGTAAAEEEARQAEGQAQAALVEEVRGVHRAGTTESTAPRRPGWEHPG